MENYYTITLSDNKLEAYLNLKEDIYEIPKFSENDIQSFLKENGLCFGIHHDNLLKLMDSPQTAQYPLLIANGKSPVNGEDGYLIPAIETNHTIVDEGQTLNFRDMVKIPSVKKGELLARIIPPTNGKKGVDVFGNDIDSKPGKSIKAVRGKNIEVNENEVFATVDGQFSINGNYVSVLPLYEVNGNLDLKVGNINFVGNVIIRGDVPDGYQIIAGGDIKIFGIVEGSTLNAEGSIYISGGIIGGNHSSITANGSIQAAYINQAIVNAGLDIIVNGAILHSECTAGGKIVSKSGSIIGGSISSEKKIIAKEIGSRAYTKTELFVGINKISVLKEKELQNEIKQCAENLNKLKTFIGNIAQKYKMMGGLSTQEIELLKKQKAVREQLEARYQALLDEWKELENQPEDFNENEIIVNGRIYPNVHLNFGKYRFITENEFKYLKYCYNHGDIISSPL